MDADVIIIGGGIAGLSAAYALGASRRVLVLERETFAGYHATGRSAALFAVGVGSGTTRALTRASHAFLQAPPAGFADHPILTPRGYVNFARPAHVDRLNAYFEALKPSSPTAVWLNEDQLREKLPLLRPGALAAGVFEPDATDIDVHGLLQGYLKGFRAADGIFVGDAQVISLRAEQGGWTTMTADGRSFRAPVVVNAAGAWVEDIAKLAGARQIAFQPMRRTAMTIELPQGIDASDWPFADDLASSFYCKPDAGLLFLSRSNETPSPPCDSQPEEIEIAEAIDHFTAVMDMDVRRVRRSWSGLRTFSPDRGIVMGFDDLAPGFLWLAGQGGIGVQTSEAAGRVAAALIRGEGLPADILDEGVNLEALSPQRFAGRA